MTDYNVKARVRSAMTVADLISELECLDHEAKVFFTCDYGDVCHTTQAFPVTSIDDEHTDENLYDSAYSQSGVAINKHDRATILDGDETRLVVFEF